MKSLLLVAMATIAVSAQTTGGQAPTPPARPVVGRDVCTMPRARGYSPGAVQSFNGDYYRCTPVLGDNARPAGLVWVPAIRLGQTYVVKQPTGPSICTLPTDVKYSAGAFQRYEGKMYRCVNGYGEDLAPPRAVWVEVASTDGEFVK